MGPKKQAKLTRNQASVNFYGGGPQDLIEKVIPTSTETLPDTTILYKKVRI